MKSIFVAGVFRLRLSIVAKSTEIRRFAFWGPCIGFLRKGPAHGLRDLG